MVYLMPYEWIRQGWDRNVKIDRLLAITMLLLNRKRISGKELADRFEVSLRTIYRDLETIGQAGIPIVSYPGADGGYEIMQGYRVERQFLTMDELYSIITALKGVGPFFDGQRMEGLLEKVRTLVSDTGADERGAMRAEQRLIVDFEPWGGQSEEARAKWRAIREAVSGSRLARLVYMDPSGTRTEREAELLSLVWKSFSWYVTAWCRLRGDYRCFKVSRIHVVQLLEETFIRDPIPPEVLNRQWEHRERMLPVKLRILPPARARAEEDFRGFRFQALHDGGFLADGQLPDAEWTWRLLFSYGPDLLVVEPAELAARLRRRAEQLLRAYEEELPLNADRVLSGISE